MKNFNYLLLMLLIPLSMQAAASFKKEMSATDQALREADRLWEEGNIPDVIKKYSEVLSSLPKEGEFFRPSIILRYARALYAAGEKEKALKQLDSLESFEYVPEHIALFAKELREQMNGKKEPGTEHTPIPPLKKADITFFVSTNAKTKASAKTTYSNIHDALKALSNYCSSHKNIKVAEIVFMPGEYQMYKAAEITFPKGMTLIIRSYDSASPALLTGGIVLKRWTKVTDHSYLSRLPENVRDRVLQCNLNDNGVPNLGKLIFGGFGSERGREEMPQETKEYFLQSARFATMPVPELFYNGEPQTMARWPNEGFTKIPINMKSDFDRGRLAKWNNEDNMWLHGYWKASWADAYEKFEKAGEDGSITVEPPVTRYGFVARRGYALNALCELDQPGEWYIDTTKGIVIYYPPENFNPEKTILSSSKSAFGSTGVSNLQIRDLNMHYFRGDVCRFIKCNNLLLTGLNISRSSGAAIKIYGGKNHLIHSVHISKMGRGGIDIISGDWKNLISGNSVIENCIISQLSRIDRTYTPGVLLEGMGIKVRNNLFYDIPSSAIRIEACSSLIELNVFRHCVYESGDQGAIDMWGNPLFRGNIIRWNFFDSITNNEARTGAAAIRCDDLMSGFMIAQNIMYKGSNRPFGSVQLNQGIDNIVEGNTIIEWSRIASGRSAYGEAWKTKLLTHKSASPLLKEVNWKNERWMQMYPMLAKLFDDSNNHNWLIGNLAIKSDGKSIIAMDRQVALDNVVKKAAVKGDKLSDFQQYMRPWYPVPLNKIGSYKVTQMSSK